MFGMPDVLELDEQGRELVLKCLECDAVGEIKRSSIGDEIFRRCGACETIECRTEWVVADE